jgi:hypothetical protein
LAWCEGCSCSKQEKPPTAAEAKATESRLKSKSSSKATAKPSEERTSKPEDDPPTDSTPAARPPAADPPPKETTAVAATARSAGGATSTAASAIEAHHRAADLAEKAQGQQKRGSARAAYQSALEAYELATRFPDDPHCAALASELLPLLEELGESLPRGNFGAERPLMIK